ncbi:uncharacterized protein LOC132624420 [Lycium barbarum]|uniref:uncharacterized protein LOC132624420 n=1 Tax=Lycium barbarum TaxID=112863 RepID=UPI00293EFE28|nr:uncharacterized protein LOC132624420 [Lycium barbarum]
MSSITTVIRHSGFWNEQNCFVDYKLDAVVFKDYCSYGDLVETIAIQLGVDISRKTISIKYVVEGDNMPIEIRNNMGVRVYVELKRENRGFEAYPLCVSITDNDLENFMSGESAVGDDMFQLEFNDYMYAINVVDSNDLDASDCAKAVVLFQNNDDLIISNKEHKDVFVDQIYKDKDTLKNVMANYAIRKRFNFRTERSNAVSYTLVCCLTDCRWKFRASSIANSEMFRVRSFHDEHTCPLKDKVYSQRQVTSWLIGASVVKPKIANHKRKYTPGDIVDDVKNEYGVDVSYMTAWRAREKAMNELRGEPTESYKKLPGYVYILDKTYPGSHVRMHISQQNEFLYLFITLKAFIKGFECCRPIVVVDGSHLKTTYNGTFVSASTLDGAVPICFMLYFTVILHKNMYVQFKQAYGNRDNMCVVSDRHESIIKASNGEVLSPVFYALAKAYTQAEFDKLMEKIEKVDFLVKEYLEDAGREKWARLYSPVNRGWTMTSNIAECINGKLVAARELPVFDFLEEVRKMFGRWNCTNRRNGTYTFTTLGKAFQQLLSINECKSLRMTVEPSTEYVYTVNDEARRFIIDLKKKTCNLFKPKTVIKTYDVPVDPLPDETEWNIPKHISDEVVLPPRYKRPPGRPKKKRDKPLMETMIGKRRNACSTCGCLGHNRRSCSNESRKK